MTYETEFESLPQFRVWYRCEKSLHQKTTESGRADRSESTARPRQWDATGAHCT